MDGCLRHAETENDLGLILSPVGSTTAVHLNLTEHIETCWYLSEFSHCIPEPLTLTIGNKYPTHKIKFYPTLKTFNKQLKCPHEVEF